jgi:hypothetical protein
MTLVDALRDPSRPVFLFGASRAPRVAPRAPRDAIRVDDGRRSALRFGVGARRRRRLTPRRDAPETQA